MTFFNPNEKIDEIVEKDPRYSHRAYEFVFQALSYTQQLHGRTPPEQESETIGPQHHVSGPELLDGIRQLALREFGLMARTVFHLWGIDRTDDFGEIVFNLIDAELMSRTPRDSREDFCGVYDLDQALVQEFRIQLDEAK